MFKVGSKCPRYWSRTSKTLVGLSEPQKAFGVVTQQEVNTWLDDEQPTFISRHIPSKPDLDLLVAKFAWADSKRKNGGLP
jgi:hypothetical protein